MNEFFAQGRIVWGHPCKLQQVKDDYGKPKVDDQGNKVEQTAFGLAVPKDYFNQHCWPVMSHVAGQAFPNGVPQNFSWKYVDGDTGTDSKGRPFNQMPGRAGCMIIAYTTHRYANTVYKMENGVYREMAADEVKCGDFVAVKTAVKFNEQRGGTRKPGLYVNVQGIVHIGYGEEIQSSSADPEETFAGFQAMQMPGMSQQPVMNTSAPMPSTMGGMTPPQQMQQPQQQGGQLPPPAMDFVHNVQGQAPQQAGQPAQQGFTQPTSAPVQNVGQPNQQYQSNMGYGGAPNATISHSNGVPGMPNQR